MKLYVVVVAELYSDPDTLEITQHVNSKAFKTLEEARKDMIERYEYAQENVLEYYIDDKGQLELDSYGYTADGHGQAIINDRNAKVSTWSYEGINNVVEIKIEEVEVAE